MSEDKVELTNAEVENMKARTQNIITKENELVMSREAAQYYFGTILKKYGKEGIWEWQGNFIVKRPDPEGASIKGNG